MTPPRFFFDRCCPVKIARVIQAFEEDHVVRYYSEDSRFQENTDDVVWMKVLGDDKLNWVILSMDGKILKRPHERQALLQSKLPYFLLGSAWMNMEMPERCWKLLKVWPEIVRTARETRHRIFEVKAGSSIKIEAVNL